MRTPFPKMAAHGLKFWGDSRKEKILKYELLVYFCEGKPSETIEWFETINIAGKPLYPQEIRNAVYQGPWITDAKRYFSKTNCPAQKRAAAYLAGSAIRQDYLETAIRWTAKTKTDEDVDNKKGIVPYVLTRDEKWLHIRAFSDKMKLFAYERQKHRCANPNCPDKGRAFDIGEMEADHITPWCEGGATVQENCQMLCRLCNRRKGSR